MEALARLRKKQEQLRKRDVDVDSLPSSVPQDMDMHVQFILSRKGDETADLLVDHGNLRALLSDILETRSFQLQLRDGIAKVSALYSCCFTAADHVMSFLLHTMRAGSSYIADQCHRVRKICIDTS
jgi:hypothetical protein